MCTHIQYVIGLDFTIPGVELSINLTRAKPEYYFINGWTDKASGRAEPIDFRVNRVIVRCPTYFLPKAVYDSIKQVNIV